MKPISQIILFLFLPLLSSCIVQFVPETDEDKDQLVVEALITDQPGVNTVKLSKSVPLGSKKQAKPVKGCDVWISDDLDNLYNLHETIDGTYVTNPAEFQGTIGRQYVLHIKTDAAFNNYTFESYPMAMNPVPSIDSLYYERVVINESEKIGEGAEGCQVYFNTLDQANNCKYYRWEYTETWKFRIPFEGDNRICWISNNSSVINLKNTSVLEENRINRYPLLFISNNTDRLKETYSILLNQYSLNENEYLYWEKLQNLSEEIGGLYDITPSAIPSNMWCVEDPNEKVLGYFSVSARSSKRIFIKEYFKGIIDLYKECISDTVGGYGSIPYLNLYVWILEDHSMERPSFRVLTEKEGCADCTVRGTTVKPDFWDDDK